MKKPILIAISGVAVATVLSFCAARSFIYRPAQKVDMEFITETNNGTTTYRMRVRQGQSDMTSSLPGRATSVFWNGSTFTVQGDHAQILYSSSLALPQPTRGNLTLQLLQTEKVQTPHSSSSSSHGFVRPIAVGERFELR